MKNFLCATAAALALASSANALTYDIDLQGFHGIGSSITGTVTFGSLNDGGPPDAWDLMVEAPALVANGYNPLFLNSADIGNFLDFTGLAGSNAGATAWTVDMTTGWSLYIHNFGGISGSEMGLCLNSFANNICNGSANGIGLIVESGQQAFGAASGVVTLGTITPVPLPASAALMLGALGVLGSMRRRR